MQKKRKKSHRVLGKLKKGQRIKIFGILKRRLSLKTGASEFVCWIFRPVCVRACVSVRRLISTGVLAVTLRLVSRVFNRTVWLKTEQTGGGGVLVPEKDVSRLLAAFSPRMNHASADIKAVHINRMIKFAPRWQDHFVPLLYLRRRRRPRFNKVGLSGEQ